MRPSENQIAKRLGENMRTLRETRVLTQAQIGKLAGLPRATWSNLESGMGNPTLAVLHRVAAALQVSIEELIARSDAGARHYPRGSLPTRIRGNVEVRRLLPDPIPGMELDRMTFPPGSHLTGVPHTPGAREYLVCESGEFTLHAGGEQWHLRPGDLVAFRGDQRHSYLNRGHGVAIGYSVVVLARVA
jgi:transcriptional regulator with XRE-family HTH domain